jgi:hypothetical protein
MPHESMGCFQARNELCLNETGDWEADAIVGRAI